LTPFVGGVHRVQRVPATESKGRVHTSTAVVVVLPKPSDIHVVVHDKDIKVNGEGTIPNTCSLVWSVSGYCAYHRLLYCKLCPFL